MVKRVGIGATAASAVVFSVILLSNLALFMGSQGRASMYVQSSAEDLLAGEAAALVGSAATNLLLEVQSILSAGPMDCSAAATFLAAAVGGLADVQHGGPLVVRATSHEVPDSYSADNLTMVSPFNGSVQGDLNIGLSFSEVSALPLAGVTFARNESHLVHLPVHWDSELQGCIQAVRAVAESVSTTHVSNCTVTTVGPLMAAATAGPEASSNSEGFTFGVTYSISDTNPCTVGFQVSIGQLAIDGPVGVFNVLLEGRGSASFA